MSASLDRPKARAAPEELLVLQRAEEAASWLLQRTARWPKSARFVTTQRIENHVLDVLEAIVVARYERPGRLQRLQAANLALERVRFLLRIARATSACPAAIHEGALKRLDEIGRMLHGWRSTIGAPADRTDLPPSGAELGDAE